MQRPKEKGQQTNHDRQNTTQGSNKINPTVNSGERVFVKNHFSNNWIKMKTNACR
jgi:hypothetical protein